MFQISTLECDTFLKTLRDQPRQINGSIDADRGEGIPVGKLRVELFFAQLSELEGASASAHCCGYSMCTFGTTSLYQGSGFNFSARYLPVEELASLDRL